MEKATKGTHLALSQPKKVFKVNFVYIMCISTMIVCLFRVGLITG